MKVRQLTAEQKNILVGKVWGYQGQFFNPQIDADGNWFISNEEVNGCTYENNAFEWIHELLEIEHNPIINETFN
jgi:hypothetical protein